MGPKINGSNMAELVKQEVIKTVETQKHEMLEIKRMIEAELDRVHELLLGALARITCLEKEIEKYKQTSRHNSISLSSRLSKGRSSWLCKHWLRDRCTWQEHCRFSHGNDGGVSSSESATSGLQLSPNSCFQAEEPTANNIKVEVQPVDNDSIEDEGTHSF